MTIATIYGGPLKRELIQPAYEMCGQAGYEFELTPEEYDSALRRMNMMLARWKNQLGIDLGYNFPSYGNGSAEDESGVPDDAVEAIVQSLARVIAPGIGKTLGAEANAVLAETLAALRSTYMTIPSVQFGRGTIRGAGNRRSTWRGPYFPVCD